MAMLLLLRLIVMMMMGLGQVCVDIFQERGHQADVKANLTVEQLHGIVGNYDGMVIRSATKVGGEARR